MGSLSQCKMFSAISRQVHVVTFKAFRNKLISSTMCYYFVLNTVSGQAVMDGNIFNILVWFISTSTKTGIFIIGYHAKMANSLILVRTSFGWLIILHCLNVKYACSPFSFVHTILLSPYADNGQTQAQIWSHYLVGFLYTYVPFLDDSRSLDVIIFQHILSSNGHRSGRVILYVWLNSSS